MRHAETALDAASRPVPPGSEAPALTARELAHELNSLLDGSMRCLSLARLALDAGATAAELIAAADRLRLAEQAMNGMAERIAQVLRDDGGSLGQYATHRSLSEEVDRCLAAVAGLAAEHDVDLVTHIAATAADLPAGALGTILLNGLRNAVQAVCEGAGASLRQVELSLEVNPRNELVILISDSGPGVPHAGTEALRAQNAEFRTQAGHGIGLELSRRIAAAMGGSLKLVNVPFGPGAVLRVVVPVSRLVQR